MTFWRWVLLIGVLFTLALLGSVALLLHSLLGMATEGIHISVNGEAVPLGTLPIGSLLMAAGGVLVALLVVVCVVPLAVLAGLAAAALGIGAALCSVLGVAALLLSPLLLLALGLWWVLRPSSSKRRPSAAA